MKKNVVLYSSNKKSHGALAQLGAHDTGSVGVTGSSPVCSITRKGRFARSFLVVLISYTGLEAALRKRHVMAFLAVTVDEPCAAGADEARRGKRSGR